MLNRYMTNEHYTIPTIFEKYENPDYLPTHQEVVANYVKQYAAKRGLWQYECKDHGIFEIYTHEYIQALAEYIYKQKPKKVLEICAGDGKLTHLLQQFIQIPIAATDIKGENYRIHKITERSRVETLSAKEALNIHSPDLVLCAWMPLETDLTQHIRACPSVKEYILIGETNMCGDGWLTWGSQAYISTKSYEDEQALANATADFTTHGGIPPSIRDGFVRTALEDIAKYSICRTDIPGRTQLSSTVSFKRK